MVAVPGVVAPTTSSVVLRSSSVFTGALCHTVVTWISRLVLPIQLNFAGSNFAVCGCSSGAVGRPLMARPKTLPSCGPTDRSEVASRIEPAPATFCTIMAGCPGMWRGI